MMKKVIDYLLSNDLAEIPQRGRKELKSIIIDNKKFRYNKDKPISNVLTKKLLSVKKTNEYRSYALNKAKGAFNEGRVKQLLTKHAIRNKFKVRDIQSAFRRYANSIVLENKHFEGERGLEMIAHQRQRLSDFLRNNRNMKLNIRTEGLFEKPEYDDGGTEIGSQELIYALPSTYYPIHNQDELTQALEDSVKQILLQIQNLEGSTSNLRFKNIFSITIHYDKFDPTRAGRFIELPEWIKLKKACINIKNKDQKCFKYCIQSVVYDKISKHHPEEMFHYNKLKDDILNWDGVNFPTGNRDIDRFEENNKLVSINVFETDDCLNDNKIIIHRGTKNRNAKYEIDLLKVYDEDNNYHYVLVKNKSRLLNCQSNKNINKKHYCHHCLNPFSTEKARKKHLEKGCMASEGQQTKMPDKDTYIEFEKHNTKLPCPFVIYGDFECLTTNSNTGIKGTYQEHKPCGYMLNVVSRIDNTCQPYLYRGEDCMKQFVEKLTEIKKDIFEKMNMNKPMDDLTNEQKIEFKLASNCSICGKKFEPDDEKVRDHCHFTGKYRGAAHVKCNLDYSFRYFKIPIFFHNLKNYDAHLIIAKANELNIELNQNKRIDVIAQNSEKFITFSFGACQFKDSFAFLTASLDKLVRLNKYEGNEKIKDWETHFRYTSTNPYIKSKTDLNLLTDKGVYPYDYMNSWDKFDETQLPKKEDFYSHLYEENITDKDYARANIVWKHFNIKNLGEYHDLYLMTDVYLLTDVFENFRDMCLNYYGLDPAYYLTLPNYSWNAFLSLTEVRLQQIHIKEMYELIENGLRGGMTQCSCKKLEANNKYMNEDYDKSKPSSYISYLDANNLYGLAMCKKLPYDDFKWYHSRMDEKRVMKYSDDDDTGYILEVDLDYPKELHDLHKDYPLAPEIMSISENMLSQVQKDIHKYYNGKDASDEKSNKLVLNVMDKKSMFYIYQR